MRYLYSVLLYLATPLLLVRLWRRAKRNSAYKERVRERFGSYPFSLEKCIWIHAVSVGETAAASSLIKLLQSRYPDLPILLTTMTPSGSARVKKEWGDQINHVYLPYDFPHAVQRFLQTMNPKIAIIMETELWPNLLHACHKTKIPVCLFNARLSESSARGYRRIAPLMRQMLSNIKMIAANSLADAQRLIALGALKECVTVTGNIKFDVELPVDLNTKNAELRKQLNDSRFIWIAASTHQGEEEQILAAHKMVRQKHPHALLILVPRHPERFDEVSAMSQQLFTTIRRSENIVCDLETGVYVADTMGELLLLFSVANLVMMGGSLIPHGGHNILEAAALAKPILIGESYFNFQEIINLFAAENALLFVKDANTLAQQILMLIENPKIANQMSQRALQIMNANRGVREKQFALLEAIPFA